MARIYGILFIRLVIHGHVGYSRLLAPRNKAAMSGGVDLPELPVWAEICAYSYLFQLQYDFLN